MSVVPFVASLCVAALGLGMIAYGIAGMCRR